MKKINSKTIIILAIVLALLVSLVASASAAYTRDASSVTVGYSTDDGYVTMDTFVNSFSGRDTYVRDLFITGGIGTAESTGVLFKSTSILAYDEQPHWTLKDGVLVIDGPSNGVTGVTSGAPTNSPFWNNPYIETIVISANVTKIDGLIDGAMFYFGLPNLKNVIFLGKTAFIPYRSDVPVENFTKEGTYGPFGDFPRDHEINYVWANVYGTTTFGNAEGKAGVGTSNDIADFRSASDKNSFFDSRSAWLTAAAPVIGNAKLNQQAIDLMPADMVSAVNAIGGFKNTADGTSTQAPVADTQPVTPAAPASAGITVTVNGTPVVWTDAEPFIDENSRTMVPLRAVADAMGIGVDWNANRKEAVFGKNTFTDDGVIIECITFTIGNTTAIGLGGKTGPEIPMDTAAVIVNDRTYAPIRYLAEFFGYTVGWDAATRTVTIVG